MRKSTAEYDQAWRQDRDAFGWTLPGPAPRWKRLLFMRIIRAAWLAWKVERHYEAWPLPSIRTGYDEWVIYAIRRGWC